MDENSIKRFGERPEANRLTGVGDPKKKLFAIDRKTTQRGGGERKEEKNHPKTQSSCSGVSTTASP